MKAQGSVVLTILLLLTACYSGQRSEMLALLDEADSLNRAYAQLPSDTLLLEAADFFDRHGSRNEQVRAHYLLGCAYRDQGQAPEALQAWQDAIDRADTLNSNCDFRLLSRVYGQAGDLFTNETLHREAIRQYLQCSKYAWRAKDTLTAILGKGQLVSSYYALAELDSSIAVCRETRSKLSSYGYQEMANSFLNIPIIISLERQQYKEALNLIESYEHYIVNVSDHGLNDPHLCMLYYYKGRFFEGVNNTDSALFYYHQLVTKGNTTNNVGLGYSGLYSIYKTREVRDSLIKYSNLYTSYLDSTVNNIKESKLQIVQGLYDYTKYQNRARVAERKAEKLRITVSLVVLALGITVLVTYFIIIIIRISNKRQQQHISSKYALAIIEYGTLKSIMRNTEQAKEEFHDKYEALNTEYELAKEVIIELQSDKRSPDQWDLEDSLLSTSIVRKFHKMASGVHDVSDSDWIELRQIVRQYMPHFMDTISSFDYQLNRRETNLCILLRLRFIPSEICVLLNVSKNNLGNIRKRLLKKMYNQEGSSKTFDELIYNIPR